MSITAGDRVTLDYVGRFTDGTVFATSQADVAGEHDLVGDPDGVSPLSFTVGNGEVIRGLDEAVVGMTPGESETVTVPPADAYGEYEEDRVREYDPETFEAMVGQPPEIGLHVEAQQGLHGDVTAIAPEAVEVDFNHELAGKTLVFEIDVLDVQ
ncbi:MAG: peptidylprolyl isomerase [Halovenus sp.]